MNKVKWHREGTNCVPYMFEEHNQKWGWVRYTKSRCFKPDNGYHVSKGFASFMNALKLGYESIGKTE